MGTVGSAVGTVEGKSVFLTINEKKKQKKTNENTPFAKTKKKDCKPHLMAQGKGLWKDCDSALLWECPLVEWELRWGSTMGPLFFVFN